MNSVSSPARRAALSLLFVAALLSSAAPALAEGACQLTGAAGATPSDPFTQAMEQSVWLAAGVAFVFGFGVALTPCVYPMVAITVSVFGARKSSSRWEGAALSATYVLGIVAMFVPLGLMAASTGEIFGSLLQNRWLVSAISLLFVVMAVSLFGGFDLALPSSWQTRLAGVGRMGFVGAFLLGLVLGVVAAPCTGPVLAGILLWIARTHDLALGALMMTLFALGLGVPFFIVGTFAVQLPKSGKWMVHVKSLLGLVMLVVALYFLGGAFPALAHLAKPTTLVFGLAAALVAAGVGLGAVHLSLSDGGAVTKLRKALGVTAVAAGAYLGLMAYIAPARSLEWRALDPFAACAEALAAARPVLMDFTAEWCAACKELDAKTFSDDDVRREAGRFLAVKVDMTDDEAPGVDRLREEHGVAGLPVVLLLDSKGAEAARCVSFVGPDDFVKVLEAVR